MSTPPVPGLAAPLDEPVTCPRGCTRPSLIPGRPPLPVLCDPVYAGHGSGIPYATGWFRCPACGHEYVPGELAAPRLEALCTAHGVQLPLCDHCASTRIMAAWAGSLSGSELAGALGMIDRYHRHYAPAEVSAVLAEAARRVRG